MDKRGINKGRSGKRSAAIVGGLLIVLSAVCVRFLMPSPSKASAAGMRPGKSPAASERPAPAAAQGNPKLEMDWPMELARDPFTSALVFPPPTAPIVTPPEVEDEAKLRAAKTEELVREVRANVKLNGTFLGAQPQAIINGRPCKVGDVVHGFAIKRIGARDVIVEKDGIQLLVTAE